MSGLPSVSSFVHACVCCLYTLQIIYVLSPTVHSILRGDSNSLYFTWWWLSRGRCIQCASHSAVISWILYHIEPSSVVIEQADSHHHPLLPFNVLSFSAGKSGWKDMGVLAGSHIFVNSPSPGARLTLGCEKDQWSNFSLWYILVIRA